MDEKLKVIVEADDSQYQQAMDRVQITTQKTAGAITSSMEKVRKKLGPDLVAAAEAADYPLETLAEVFDNLKASGYSSRQAIHGVRQGLADLGVDRAKDSISSASETVKGKIGSMASSVKERLQRIGLGAKLFLANMAASAVVQFAQMAAQALGDVISWAQATGGTFGSTMTELQNATSEMRANLGAAFANLLATLAPIILQVISWVNALITAISQIFAALGGRSTYVRAKQGFSGVGEAVSGVGSAAKGANAELKKTLLSFDEINALQDQSSSGGGGGGGGGGSSGIGDMFEEVPIETEGLLGLINNIAKRVGPVLKGIVHFIKHDIIENGINALSGGITALTGTFEGNKEKWLRGMDQIRDVVADTGWLNAIVKGIYNILRVIINTAGEIYKALLNLGIKLLEFFRPVYEIINSILKFFHIDAKIDVDGWISSLQRGIDEVERGEEVNNRFWDSWNQWADGKITTDELYTANHNLNKGIEATGRTVKDVSGKYSAFGAAGANAAGRVRSAMERTTTASDTAGRSVDKVKSNVDVINKMNPRFSGIQNGMSGLGGFISDVIWKLSGLKTWIDKVNGSTIHLSTSGYIHGGGSLGHFAAGGYPDQGELFVAREAGPEMVGTIGGRTAVANNADIVAAIEGGVFNAMVRAGGAGSSGTQNTEVNVYMDNEVVARAAIRGQKALNRRYNVNAYAL